MTFYLIIERKKVQRAFQLTLFSSTITSTSGYFESLNNSEYIKNQKFRTIQISDKRLSEISKAYNASQDPNGRRSASKISFSYVKEFLTK